MTIAFPASFPIYAVLGMLLVPGSLSVPLRAEEVSEKRPPELTALDEQFSILRAEQVTGPFNEGVTKLNTGYLDRLKKLIAEEKAAGNLDAILALDSEQEHVAFNETISDIDDEKDPPSLKAIREVYRQAQAKLIAEQTENLNTLTGALDKRLAEMESDLAKGDRVADAVIVRRYREKLDAGKMHTPSNGTSDTGFTNSLGMKFLPVKGTDVLFCIHEVRYKDYAAYAAETKNIDDSWESQITDGYELIERTEDHPVTRVNWDDAQKFCAWLSQKESKTYRLPTDQEWSFAVGIGREEKWEKDTTPASVVKDQKAYPWGDASPPPKGAGNYSDESRHAKAPGGNRPWLEGYDDTFPTTAPVMSFESNKAGLHDLGGNVWEWVNDWYDNAQKDRVLRGGSWYERGHMLSSSRGRSTPENRNHSYGFRVVLVSSGG